MNPINVGIITGALLFIALLQANIIISVQTLSPSAVASGQNLYSGINVQGISVAAFVFGIGTAVLEVIWPGTVKHVQLHEEKEEDEEMRNELQESLDEFEEQESTDQK